MRGLRTQREAMPPADAPGPIPEALSAAVLGDESTLLRILALGALSAYDLAAVAQVARLWRRVVGSEALWNAAWLREAPSLSRGVSARAGGASRGGPAALSLEQMHVAVELAGGRRVEDRNWRLEDFVFAVDVTWRGAPIFASTRDASRVDETLDESSVLTLYNTLAFDDGSGDARQAAQCASLFQQPGVTGLVTAAAEAAAAELRVRLFVQRSDGALVCLLAGTDCDDLIIYGGPGTWVSEAAWDSTTVGEVRNGNFRTRDDDALEPWRRVCLRVRMRVYEEVPGLRDETEKERRDVGALPPPGTLFRSADLCMSWDSGEQYGWEPVFKSELLRALARKELNWVSTHGRMYR